MTIDCYTPLRILGTAIRYLVGLWLLAAAVGVVIWPSLMTYVFFGVEWAAIVGIATVGVAAFLVKFGPWLFARMIARAIAKDVKRMAENIEEENERARRARERSESVEDWSEVKGNDDWR